MLLNILHHAKGVQNSIKWFILQIPTAHGVASILGLQSSVTERSWEGEWKDVGNIAGEEESILVHLFWRGMKLFRGLFPV